MSSERLRRHLRQESQQWLEEGLIDADFYLTLSDRYQFTTLEAAASNRFISILLGVGGILLGLGAITFVAANWQQWSREFRVFLLLSLLVAINAAGYYLWQWPAPQRGQHRLGHGLLLTGALILGANLALMSQMFHQSGATYVLYLVWSFGVGIMAYSLRLTSLGVVAWILMFIGYWLWWFDGIGWSVPFTTTHSALQLLFSNMALVVGVAFLPLAFWCRSRVIFALTCIAVVLFFVYGTFPVSLWNVPGAGGVVAISLTLPPALLWAYHPSLWRLSRMNGHRVAYTSTSTRVESFEPIARSLAIWCLSVLFYILSFHWLWVSWGKPPTPEAWTWTWQPGADVDMVIGLLVAGWGWLRLIERSQRMRGQPQQWVNSVAIALFVSVTAALCYWHIRLHPLPILAPIVINLMLFQLAVSLLRDGLALGSRLPFWGGMSLLILGIISRIFEYNTDLLLKAGVLLACGTSVIAAGLWFERRLLSHPRSESTPFLPEQLS
jgi:uncharacterized membrane protein